MSDVESVSSNVVLHQADVECKPDKVEPPHKRRREHISTPKDLHTRLWTVLACSVCFDLPEDAIYQCHHGHLMCNGCFNHLLADARLKNEQATCPSCRVDLGQFNCSRNLAAEKAVSELPGECKFCNEEFPRHQISWHENELCLERTVKCKYALLGCTWTGKCCLKEEHESRCPFPSKSGTDLMETVGDAQKAQVEENTQLKNILKMMSFEKIAICDIQLSPSRTDDYIPRLYYETNRFSAFEQTWILKAKVVGDEKSCDRKLTYQVCSRG